MICAQTLTRMRPPRRITLWEFMENPGHRARIFALHPVTFLNVLCMFQSLPLATKKIWENLGSLRPSLLTLYLADHVAVIPSCCQSGTNFPTKSCFRPLCDTRYAHLNPKISIASHEIPWHPLFIERRDGQTNAGAAIDPEQGEKRQAHTGNRLRLTRQQRSGAQASRHLPQVASA